MTTLQRSLLVLTMIVISSTAVLADQPVICITEIQYAPTQPVCLVVAPDGSGAPFTEARVFGGEAVDATLRFRLVDYPSGDPLWGYPTEDVWLEFNIDTATACSYGFSADAYSDIEGFMEFTLPMSGGGTSSEDVYLMLSGSPSFGWDLEHNDMFSIYINSPDINGDLVVDLTDIVIFTTHIGVGCD